VFGVEVDASRGFRKSTIAASVAAGTPEVSSELEWLFSARARAGIAMGSRGEWLPFLTGGWGYASHEFSVVSGGAGPGFGPYGSVRVRGGGFVGGGGLEYGVTPWASLRVEGLHYATRRTKNFSDNELNDADVGDFVRYRGVTVVRGALNIRWGGAAPVVARY
jgi:opacity protein-like surface antigen